MVTDQGVDEDAATLPRVGRARARAAHRAGDAGSRAARPDVLDRGDRGRAVRVREHREDPPEGDLPQVRRQPPRGRRPTRSGARRLLRHGRRNRGVSAGWRLAAPLAAGLTRRTRSMPSPRQTAGAEELVHLLGGALQPDGRLLRQVAVVPPQEAEESLVELSVDPHLVGAVDGSLAGHPWRRARRTRRDPELVHLVEHQTDRQDALEQGGQLVLGGDPAHQHGLGRRPRHPGRREPRHERLRRRALQMDLVRLAMSARRGTAQVSSTEPCA